MNEYIKNTCKIGQGSDCCKYLLLGKEGFTCGKVSEHWKKTVDESWANGNHVAQGDNCEGIENLKEYEKIQVN